MENAFQLFKKTGYYLKENDLVAILVAIALFLALVVCLGESRDSRKQADNVLVEKRKKLAAQTIKAPETRKLGKVVAVESQNVVLGVEHPNQTNKEWVPVISVDRYVVIYIGEKNQFDELALRKKGDNLFVGESFEVGKTAWVWSQDQGPITVFALASRADEFKDFAPIMEPFTPNYEVTTAETFMIDNYERSARNWGFLGFLDLIVLLVVGGSFLYAHKVPEGTVILSPAER